MQPRLLTPSKITAWLDCAHFLTLQHQVEAGDRPRPNPTPSDMAEMLMEKGLQHERDCLAQYKRDGKAVFSLPTWDWKTESFESFQARAGNPMADGHDVIYQMPFVHDGVRGIADFLERVDHPDGSFTYEPLDAKLARKAAKPGHVLQLCFYADAITAMTGRAPEHLHIWLGTGKRETIRVNDVAAYWRRLRQQLRTVVTDDAPTDTVPVPCKHCDFCAFAPTCKQQWRDAKALHLVAGLRSADRPHLEAAGIVDMEELSRCTTEVAGVDPVRGRRLVRQASLQLQAAELDAPPFEHVELEPDVDPSLAVGFAAMPASDDGDVFLDYEGHPFWSAREELFFLFGLIARNADGDWEYETRWAHDKPREKAQTAALIEWFVERRRQYPDMHVYHYNHTERSSLVRLAKEHTIGETALDELIQTGLFVDLYPVVQQSLIVGAESYGLKKVEKLATFERRAGVDNGAEAVLEYDRYIVDRDDAHLDAIALYNDDDVRATLALRDWLLEQRPTDLPWRPSVFAVEEATRPDIDDAAVQLMARYDEKSAEYLLGHLLGYWRREWKAAAAGLQVIAAQEPDKLLAEPRAITGMVFDRHVARTGAKQQPITPSIMFDFPEQLTAPKLVPRKGAPPPKVVYRGPDGMMGYSEVVSIDPEAGHLELLWPEKAQTLGIIPDTVVLNDHVPAKPKPDTLLALANSVLDPDTHGRPSPLALSLLRREPPRFTAGHEPKDGVFTDQVDQLRQLVVHLDQSCLPIQGPPGTGKTYNGARMVLELVLQNKRVGVTAMSHHAIENFMKGVVEAFTEAGELGRLNAVQKVSHSREDTAHITYATSNGTCKKSEFNVVAGTTWLFSGKDLRDAPVDVLFIDEAGQLSLADAIAAASSATNLVLLGDPLQLPQVAQAAHPGRSGLSVLEHILGDERTIPNDRGAFLSTTRRMHPDVSRFISEQIYEGRLHTHPSCARQGTTMGTGLRWIEVHHDGYSTSSPVEAAAVHEAIAGIIGQEFTDAGGEQHTIAPEHLMVVAPYNDQVNLLQEALDADPATRGVKVGTVDKFQGQEAPVVFFTMTASTAADIPRGADFLFSKNRLNVAISRAKAIAYLVCTEDLLNSRATDVDDMKLISTLCAFVEHC